MNSGRVVDDTGWPRGKFHQMAIDKHETDMNELHPADEQLYAADAAGHRVDYTPFDEDFAAGRIALDPSEEYQDAPTQPMSRVGEAYNPGDVRLAASYEYDRIHEYDERPGPPKDDSPSCMQGEPGTEVERVPTPQFDAAIEDLIAGQDEYHKRTENAIGVATGIIGILVIIMAFSIGARLDDIDRTLTNVAATQSIQMQ